MADGGIWRLGYVGGFIPQTPRKSRSWLKPIHLTKSELLRLQTRPNIAGRMLKCIPQANPSFLPGPLQGPLAQLAEHRTFNPGVVGSIPTRPTFLPACTVGSTVLMPHSKCTSHILGCIGHSFEYPQSAAKIHVRRCYRVEQCRSRWGRAESLACFKQAAKWRQTLRPEGSFPLSYFSKNLIT